MTDTDIKYECEDEIELMDILLVIWRWKIFIIVSTTLVVIAALGFLFLSKNIYRVSMVIEPNILEVINDTLEKKYIDSPKNIEALINSGILNYKITTELDVEEAPPVDFTFAVKNRKFTNKLEVSLDSSSPDKAVEILKVLKRTLSEQYQEVLDNYMEIQEGKLIAINKKFFARTNIQSEIKEINLKIAEIKEKIKDVKQQSETFYSQQKSLATRQSDQPMTEIMLLFVRKIDVESRLNSLQNLIFRMEQDKWEKQRKIDSGEFVIKELDYERHQIQDRINRVKLMQTNNEAIMFVNPPLISSSPVKPKKRLVLSVAFVAGFMISLFSAFFLDYIRNFKNRLSKTERGQS